MSWLRRYDPRPGARLRLVCLPHAGGTAGAFRSWAALLPPTVELLVVQYPGREERLGEPVPTTMDELAGAVVGALAPLTDRPYAVFGHSLGAVVGFETVLRLRRSGRPEPERLFVSGREAPRHSRPGDVHRGSDAQVLEELSRLGGTPAEVLRHAELRAMVLDRVRADYRIAETYRPSAGLLSCAITAVVGDADPDVLPVEAADWHEVTTGSFDLVVLPGDHSHVSLRPVPAVAEVLRRLGPIEDRSTGDPATTAPAPP